MSTASWRTLLEKVAGAARAKVVGIESVREFHHGLLVTTALRAFGDDPRAMFYVETLPPATDIPRPDLVMLHPDVGVLVIENKGVSLDDILSADGSALTIVRDGRPKREDPFRQAERVMYRLKDMAAKRTDLDHVFFLRMVSLPAITESDFKNRLRSNWSFDTIFKECFESPEDFRIYVRSYADHEFARTGKKERLSRHASDMLRRFLLGQTVFSPPRPAVTAPSETLGHTINTLESVLREHTPQQAELCKLDVRGHHRLFRGVAGSGKTIILVSLVARTLRRALTGTPALFDAPPQPPHILVVCFNRTLVHYLRPKFEEEYSRIGWTPMAECATVKFRHFEALVRDLEAATPAIYSGLSWDRKTERAEFMLAAFDQLDATLAHSLAYDAVFVDEAQDLEPAELRLLLRLARKDTSGNQTFVLFYDNAQNIYGVPTPVWEHMGISIVGRTVFMDKCLRNTQQTLQLAFNVLVGSCAPEGLRVTTRQFADVQSLRQRDLITETDRGFDIHFTTRTGPAPTVAVHDTRPEEIKAVAKEIGRLIRNERVLPSDILVLYRSHLPFKNLLPLRLGMVVAPDYGIRLVDGDNFANKNGPLLEPGILTVSTLASAKGYDAPIVFLMGADDLTDDTKGRAQFYVAATRAKYQLHISGIRRDERTLLDEIGEVARNK